MAQRRNGSGRHVDRNGGPHVIISPDGTRLVYRIRGADGKQRLATRSLDQPLAIALAGTENATSPFFSPKGSGLGFSPMANSRRSWRRAAGCHLVRRSEIEGRQLGR